MISIEISKSDNYNQYKSVTLLKGALIGLTSATEAFVDILVSRGGGRGLLYALLMAEIIKIYSDYSVLLFFAAALFVVTSALRCNFNDYASHTLSKS